MINTNKHFLKKTLFLFTLSFFLLLSVVELGLRITGLLSLTKPKISISPKTLFQPDCNLGWKNRPGKYTIYIYDTSTLFTATVNKFGNRISSINDTSWEIEKERPIIQIYGCSATFGISSPDSANCSYKLQKKLPKFKIENKGVPGYGLSQIYLSLKTSLHDGDTPKIAVFNYADFLDQRTPQNKVWSRVISWCVAQGSSSGYDNISYPYFALCNDSIQLKQCPFNHLSNTWPLEEQLRFVNLLNLVYGILIDFKNADYFHRVSNQTALEIVEYCKINNIIPIFAELVNSKMAKPTNDILNNLHQKGFLTLDYGIDFANPIYNCGPFDTKHPNALAHSIYAQKLYQFLVEKKLSY